MQDNSNVKDSSPNCIIHSNNRSNGDDDDDDVDCFDSVDLQTNIVRKGMPTSLPLWFDSDVRGRLGVKLSCHPKELSMIHHRHPHHLRAQTKSKIVGAGTSTTRSMPSSTSTSQKSRKRLAAMDGSELLFANDEKHDHNNTVNDKASIELDGKDHRDNYKLTRSLIPGASRQYESNLIVVLDLDECLIHTEHVSTYGTVHLTRFGEGAISPFESNVEWVDISDDEDKTKRRIYIRPYALEFLQSVSSRFETHLFTAGTRGYAEFILEKFLDTDGTIFAYVHAREECTFKEDETDYYKDLRVVFDQRKKRQQKQQQQQQQSSNDQVVQDGASKSEFDEFLKRVVHVDNMSSNFLCNPSNGIVVCDFYNDHNDMTLLNVLNLLHALDHSTDVRSVLEGCFQLRTKLWALVRSYWPDNMYLKQFYPASSLWDQIDMSAVTNFSKSSTFEDRNKSSGRARTNILTKMLTRRPGSAVKATRKRRNSRINWESLHPKQTMTLAPSSTRRKRPKMGRKLSGINVSVLNETDENEDDVEREE